MNLTLPSVIAPLLHAKMGKNWLETKGLSIKRKDESSVVGDKVLASQSMRWIKPTARDSSYQPAMDTLDVIDVFCTFAREEFELIGKEGKNSFLKHLHISPLKLRWITHECYNMQRLRHISPITSITRRRSCICVNDPSKRIRRCASVRWCL